MKRAVALVDYASSDDEETDARNPPGEASQPAPPMKKKLPSLPIYLAPEAPIDNPALHQGRVRTTPHVEGQFAAYVYIPLVVERNSKLHKLLLRIFAAAKLAVPSLHPIGFSQSTLNTADETERDGNAPEDGAMELHISLSRPVYLRAHQRADFKRAVKAAAKSKRSFSASFATLSELTNDERTRTFLTLEIGAGHDDFRALSDELTPTLKSLRQKEFYQDPRFHASVAWALLDSAKSPPQELREAEPAPTLPTSDLSEKTDTPQTDIVEIQTSTAESFSSIPCFPSSLVPELTETFAQELVRTGVGTFEAEEVHVRIGKEVSRWKLQG
ncbi:uncharacterized protein TRAVEDRAFT_122213 [Trametes versicolor FP-101664 SS1]|uniref:uncharacterized protein n=1 Tax=Trametes versicolor (strain FP-101664) TaxID=717944 RepID=UPI0004622B6F|nr:uncharacterized protein TRAVEDRAFT_122213 [Trametes versicolor FP-101664 SS1]EIW59655.1 hypothetical protein TRAVEDRAFT_122213 [Trametes versicolor FP-101664 SS1]